MAKTLRCRDMGVQCDWQTRAETEKEVLDRAAKHAAEKHNMKELSKEMVAKAKAAIKTVK
jgi:predicted small metal-binding protein